MFTFSPDQDTHKINKYEYIIIIFLPYRPALIIYLLLGARTEKMFFVNTVKGMNWWMEKISSRGSIPVVVSVTDSLYAWSRKVGPHGREPVGAAACGKERPLIE